MQPENYNKWLVTDLKNLLLQYDITDKDIKGTGKNGNVIKADLIKTITKMTINDNNHVIYDKINEDINIINNEDITNIINNDVITNIINNDVITDTDNNISSLPKDMIYEILNTLDVNSIINLCHTSTIYNQYCTKTLWKNIAIREDMPIKGSIEDPIKRSIADWIKQYLYHQYEVNILIKMLKDKIIITFNLPTPYLLFGKENHLICYNGVYTINAHKVTENKMIELLMKLLYQYPNVMMYRHPIIKIPLPLRKHHLKYFISQAMLTNRIKTQEYKKAIKLWQYYI